MATAVEVLKAWKYQADRVHLSPYDSRAFPEDLFVTLYHLAKPMLGLIFPGWNTTMTLADFVGFMNTHQKGMVIGVLKPDWKVAGWAWLNEIEGVSGARKASFGFGFFRKFHRTPEIREISRLALAYWFEQIGIDVLYGATLRRNYAAIRFSREMGFNQIGVAPKFFVKDGKMEDAWLVCLERGDFERNTFSTEQVVI